MKEHLGFLTVFAVLVVSRTFADGSGTNQWGSPTNELQLSISIVGGRIHLKPNEPVMLLVRLRNLSATETVVFHRANALERSGAFSYTVIAPSGTDVSPPRAWQHYQLHGSGHFVDIPPGDLCKMQLDLSQVCTFGETGTYRITIRHQRSRWRDKEHKVWESFDVVSNTLDIDVGPSH
jgi:hypothetical protein